MFIIGKRINSLVLIYFRHKHPHPHPQECIVNRTDKPISWFFNEQQIESGTKYDINREKKLNYVYLLKI